MPQTQDLSEILKNAPLDFTHYEGLYKYFHAHPELSQQEKSTSQKIASFLASLDAYEIHTNIGGYGVVGVLKNGTGKTILLRADMDALPVKELTGLPYASSVTMRDADGVEKPVMHACGHDMHITCLLAAAELLASIQHVWSGTLIVLFQPDEERGGGAQAMVDDGLYDKIPVPDYCFGQHVMRMRAGSVGSRPGTIMAAADSLKITVFGRGGHGSLPHQTVDPALLAAHIVVRLQSIVSREIDPSDLGVVTVGSLQAGQTENIIADRAEIGLDFRTVKLETRQKIITAIRRIVEAECMASGSPKPPVFTPTRRFPPTLNDTDVASRLAASFEKHFEDFDADTPRTNVSEDFSTLGTSKGVPCCFWFIGGIDPELWDRVLKAENPTEEIAGNHSALFAPVIQPTMRVGVDALSPFQATMSTFGQWSVDALYQRNQRNWSNIITKTSIHASHNIGLFTASS
ncbi:amidohydrolase, putative [Talaromyces stipitatus ATCC 10500]|uniref:Amidohydrolase, putative n=1 Tax=Talaromyces stipitatus (strain ATCC 10500 / CBS 375.48 / QM 6759 / NRRL 1006) TaxID=441959 RepID=B8M8G3_TALSN|nr:amidohydrolase, putative [Talaromyces stipitatus ATCC 10500]EED20476.1 amidohydrolase, putative [Talaromyces stipitatus ATCC 10500]